MNDGKKRRLSLGYSPCPNDTFIFYALVHGRLPQAPPFEEVLEDIESLNSMAAREELDVVKVSFHALGHFLDRYSLLRSGGALGRGCGPLVVAAKEMDPGELASATIAIPGRLTTAALLLRLFLPETGELVEIPFDRIMGAVADGEVAAGVIIHESRFTFAEYGLHKVVDLGEWWEESTGHPIPLGGIAARRALGPELVARIESNLRESLKYAYANPDDVRGYVAQHAQEMEMEVMDAHIDLYVNDYTVDYGRDGEAAIADLMGRARAAGIVPSVDFPLFL